MLVIISPTNDFLPCRSEKDRVLLQGHRKDARHLGHSHRDNIKHIQTAPSWLHEHHTEVDSLGRCLAILGDLAVEVSNHQLGSRLHGRGCDPPQEGICSPLSARGNVDTRGGCQSFC